MSTDQSGSRRGGQGGRFDESLVNRRADGRFSTKQRAEASLGPGGVDLVGDQSLLLDPAFARHHHAAENVHDLADLVAAAPVPMRLHGKEWRDDVLAGLDPAATTEEIHRANQTLALVADQARVVHGAQGRAAAEWRQQVLMRVRYAQGDLLEQCSISAADAAIILQGASPDPTGTLHQRAVRSGALPALAVATYDPTKPGRELSEYDWDDVVARSSFSPGHAVLASRHHPNPATRERALRNLANINWVDASESDAQALDDFLHGPVTKEIGQVMLAVDWSERSWHRHKIVSTGPFYRRDRDVDLSDPATHTAIGDAAAQRLAVYRAVLEQSNAWRKEHAGQTQPPAFGVLDQDEDVSSRRWFTDPVVRQARKQAEERRARSLAATPQPTTEAATRRRWWRRDN